MTVVLITGLLVQTATGISRAASRASHAGRPPMPVAVDLMRDPAWRLALLPGIGPGRAWHIVRDRVREPAYERVEDLRRVPGIGPRTVEGILHTQAVRVLLDGRPVR